MGKRKVIEISGLNKSYGDKQVLFDITLDVMEGECFGIIGKNGAGKTTLLECIEAVRSWQGGSIKIDGISGKDSYKNMRKKFGVQLQSSSLPDEILVKESVHLFAAEHKVPVNSEIYRQFGLENKMDKKYKELSTGQKRRLHLLLALLHNPEIVILDEPSAGLDMEGKAQLYEQVINLKKDGKTVLITSHDMSEIENLCDRVAIIVNGKIVADEAVDFYIGEKSEDVIVLKTENDSFSKGFESPFAKLVSNTGRYFEFAYSSINEFMLDALHHIMNHNDRIDDIYFKKNELCEVFLEIMNGGKDENIDHKS